jgi:hypothetical protein
MNRAPRPTERPRGEPLVVLALICGGWFALRILLWQSPFGLPHQAALRIAPLPTLPHVDQEAGDGSRGDRPPMRPLVPGPGDARIIEPPPPPWPTLEVSPNVAQPLPTVAEKPSAREIVGQQLLLAAAFAHMELQPEITAYADAAHRAEASGRALAGDTPIAGRPARPDRWTGDAWLLMRNGSSGPLAPGTPSYGRSQTGAVLRYRMAATNGHRPVAYVRATRALAGPHESEVAAGFAARPLAGVPLSLAGEVRVSERPAGREVRPAAFAVTELPPARLPLGLRAEAYAQAGYVGGHFATAFVDGQARIDAPVVRLGSNARMRAGGGVWGGAQKHAARLDVGPSATLSFPLGDTQSRVALDYRMRVAGDAAPESGPVLTISAGF